MVQSRRNGHANEKQEQTRWKLSWRRRKKSAGRLKNPPVRCINPSKLPITIVRALPQARTKLTASTFCPRQFGQWPIIGFPKKNEMVLWFDVPPATSRPKRLRNSITSTILTHDSIYRSMDRDWSRWPHRAWKWPGNVWINFV